MSLKSKPARSSSNKPFALPIALPTRAKTPRLSTVSHFSSKSETGSTSSKQSNTSIKRKKPRTSQPATIVLNKPTESHHRSPSPSHSASSCGVSDTLLPSPSTTNFSSMAQNQNNRQMNRTNDRYKDKSDTKPYDILADLDDVQDHTRSSDPKLSLFDAARELQRRNITVKGISMQTLLSLQTPSVIPTTPSRAERNPLTSRQELPTFPDHLLNMGFELSVQEIALRTVLNAGATVDFNAAPYGSPSPHNGVHQCIECDAKFNSQDELDEHIAWDDRWCSHCKKRFDCRGIFDDHPCAVAIRGGGGLLGGQMLGGGRRKNTG